MEKKHLLEFYNLFGCLRKAGEVLADNVSLLRSRNNHYRDICFAMKRMKDVHEYPVKSDLIYNLLKELETNLYLYPESRIFYLKDIIQQAEPILVYLKNNRDEYNCSRNIFTISKLLKEYSEGKYDINDLSVPEQYVLDCDFLFREFSCLLASKCAIFEIDLMVIQNNLKIYLFDGNLPNYYKKIGYEENFKCNSAPIEQIEIPQLSFQMNYWDSFEDKLTDKFEKEGSAELERFYIKNGKYMVPYTPELERNRTKVPISAKGFLAYLCDYINKNFKGILPENYSFEHLYQPYFDHCLNFLIDKEKHSNNNEPPKYKIDLIIGHRMREQELLDDPHRFYYEVRDESERANVENILHEASLYWEWVQQTYVETPIRENNIDEIFFETLPSQQGVLFQKNSPSQQKNNLTLKQIALKHAWEEEPVTKQNKDEIASKFGHHSGDKLYQDYCKLAKKTDRTADPDSTKKKMENKIELFESVIELLQEAHKPKALAELNCLKDIHEKKYL